MDGQSPIRELKGVGEKTQKLFAKLDIHTVGDLLTFYPKDYETFQKPVGIAQAALGEVCAVYGCVWGILGEKRVRNLHVLNVKLSDGTGEIFVTFYNMPFLKKVLKKGGFYVFRGMVQSRGANKLMEQPKLFSLDDYRKIEGQLLPRYSLTKGLTNQALLKYMRQALTFYGFLPERYSGSMLERNGLISERAALEAIHFPSGREELLQARKRLVFDEFFSFLFMMRKSKDYGRQITSEYRIQETADTVRFLERLPFPLTEAQKRVWQEIRGDMGSPYCMNRLVQGDVGSGKTIVAVLALLMTAANGYQGALMAPTEVLALQHFETVQGYVKKYGCSFRQIGRASCRERVSLR